LITLAGLIVAPSLQLAPEGLWQIIRKFTGFYNIPIIAIVLAALFLRRSSAKAALMVVLIHIPVYATVTFWWDTGIHFIHWYAILFAIEMLLLVFWRDKMKTAQATIEPKHSVVDLTPWRWRWPMVIGLSIAILFLYVVLSPIGIAA
jgi:SSS family solute:Na+ symporter